jgi:magnesium-protoporphyrin IX monomethyl ester (oxidative) cyclase
MKLQRDIQRVLLLFPPTRIGNESHPACLPPMGLMYLAAVIRPDYEVRILDATVEEYYNITPMPGGFQRFGLAYPQIRRRIEEFRPDLVGMTCLWASSAPVIRDLTAMIKEIDPSILTVIGGAAPTYSAESFFQRDPHLDFIALGEGEYTFRDLLARVRSGEDLADIDGLAYRKPDGSLHVSPRTAFISNLDELPFPARDLVPLEKYIEIGRPQSLSSKSRRNTSFMSSRGCTARCIFCSSTKFWGGTLRVRSPENVLAEMRQLKECWGIEELQFVDDNLTSNRKAAMQIFDMMVHERLGFHWSTPNGIAIWTLTPPMVDLMKAAGCYEVTLAFESGVQEVLTEIVKKPLRLAQAAEATAYVKSVGIRTNAFFIVGFPGETLDQMRETFRFARTVKVDSAAFYVATPLPGTELLQICEEKGYLPAGFRFEDANYSRPMLTTPDFTPEQLERLVVAEFWKFNLYTLITDPVRFFRKHGSIFKNPRFAADLVWRLGRKLFRVIWKAVRRPASRAPQPMPAAPEPAAGQLYPRVEPIVSLRTQAIARRRARERDRATAG